MTRKTGYYNVDDYLEQKRQQREEIKVPPKANFLAAANHVKNLFENKKFVYGVMGGLEMLCLGYRREMPDLQFAYDDKDFHRLKAKLEADQRVRLPEGMNSLFPTKCLVRTGPPFKDEGCTHTADVEVDLVPPGCHGTPVTGSLASNLVLLSLKTEGKLKSYKGINMPHLVMTLVHYCRVRDLAWDPRKDLLFLCKYYGEEVRVIRNRLDQKKVQQNFLRTPYFSRISPEEQCKCYHVLLGTDPPPILAVTPPPLVGHRQSASTSDVVMRSGISSHTSAPSSETQHSLDLLSPLLPSKFKVSQPRASEGQNPHLEMSASSSANPRDTPKLTTGAKDSRSRYRPISAPTTRDTSPIASQAAGLHKTHLRQCSQPPMILSQNSSFAVMQPSLPYQLQPPPHTSSVVTVTQGRRSLPNLSAGTTAPIPPVSFAQTPTSNGYSTYPLRQPDFRTALEMSVKSPTLNPGQQHMKSRARWSESHPLRQHPVHASPIIERPMPPQARTSQSSRSIGVELSGTPTPTVQAYNFHVVNGDAGLNFSSQLQPAQAPSYAIGTMRDAGQLAPNRVSPPLQPSQINDMNARSKVPAPVELDAMSQLGQFIAELSVERNTPKPQYDNDQKVHEHVQTWNRPFSSAQTQSSLYPTPAYRSSPVSPPDADVDPLASQQQELVIRPLNPRTRSAPLAKLPVSLMVGGTGLHQRSLSNNRAIDTPSTVPAQPEVGNTNASHYFRYYGHATPPSSIPNSANASPQPTPISTYKAYQPPAMALSPPSLPLSPPAIPQSPLEAHRPTSFTTIKDVDGANGYFKMHRRDASDDSSRSHDSSKLALEYQAELPGYGEGYGSLSRIDS